MTNLLRIGTLVAIGLSAAGCAGPWAPGGAAGLSRRESAAVAKKAADDPFPSAAQAGLAKDGKKS